MLKIKINDIELTLEQAKEVYQRLGEIFNDGRQADASADESNRRIGCLEVRVCAIETSRQTIGYPPPLWYQTQPYAPSIAPNTAPRPFGPFEITCGGDVSQRLEAMYDAASGASLSSQ